MAETMIIAIESSKNKSRETLFIRQRNIHMADIGHKKQTLPEVNPIT